MHLPQPLRARALHEVARWAMGALQCACNMLIVHACPDHFLLLNLKMYVASCYTTLKLVAISAACNAST